MILIRAQLGNTIVDFITEGNSRKVNEIYGNGTIVRKTDVSVSGGNRLYACCCSNGYEIATYVDGVKVKTNPRRAFCSGDHYYNHG